MQITSKLRFVPYALAWGHSIVVGGSDGTVVFCDDRGSVEKHFNCSRAISETPSLPCNEFTTAEFNPTGDTVVLGNWNSFYIFTYKQRRESWEEIGPGKAMERVWRLGLCLALWICLMRVCDVIDTRASLNLHTPRFHR
mmetsp:Transcript_19952/g.60314  ORF Transcript_19952/g.60314 Transcript_19952/m.60314 type:complete len:139 (-) Transcript_19952:557-973(-)